MAGLRSESSWSVSSLGTFRDESSLQGPLLREKEGGGEGKGGREKRREGGGGGRRGRIEDSMRTLSSKVIYYG